MILEEIISVYNTKKTFKILVFVILSLPAFQYGSQMQNMLLSIYTPKHNCQHNSITNRHYASQDQCSININGSTIKCSHWNFSSIPVGRTMVSDYALVCDNKHLGGITTVIWYSTYLTQPFMGWLADRYGRKIIALLNLLMETVLSISLAFAPNIITSIILRLFIGISTAGLFVSYTWLLEMVNIEYREFIGSFYFLYTCFAEMVFPLIAYYSMDWRKTQLLSMIPSILYLLILLFPESPRWLVMNNRKEDAIKSLEQLSQFNNLKINISPEEIEDEPNIEYEPLFEAFKEPIFMRCLFITLFASFTSNLSSALIIVKQDFFYKNIFVSIFLQGLMDLFAIFLSYIVLTYCKRKNGFIQLHAIGTTFLLLSICFNHEIFWQSIMRMILGCFAKLGLMSCTQNFIMYTSELFPTTHRSFGIAATQIVNIFSFAAALYLNKLNYIHYIILNVINFLLMCSSNLLIYKLLPETKCLPFPENIADQKMLIRGSELQYLTHMRDKSEQNKRESISETNDELRNILNLKSK